jgi:hypothetical protein
MDPFYYSLWLMPCAEQRKLLQKTICRLADRFGTPVFSPHATLCSGVWERGENELVTVTNRLEKLTPFSMPVAGVDWTEHGSTFFFVQLDGRGTAFDLAAAEVDGSHGPAVGPHVSLLYGFQDLDVDRAALRDELSCSLPAEIRFDELALVCPENGDWSAVKSWQTVYATKPFG